MVVGHQTQRSTQMPAGLRASSFTGGAGYHPRHFQEAVAQLLHDGSTVTVAKLREVVDGSSSGAPAGDSSAPSAHRKKIHFWNLTNVVVQVNSMQTEECLGQLGPGANSMSTVAEGKCQVEDDSACAGDQYTVSCFGFSYFARVEEGEWTHVFVEGEGEPEEALSPMVTHLAQLALMGYPDEKAKLALECASQNFDGALALLSDWGVPCSSSSTAPAPMESVARDNSTADTSPEEISVIEDVVAMGYDRNRVANAVGLMKEAGGFVSARGVVDRLSELAGIADGLGITDDGAALQRSSAAPPAGAAAAAVVPPEIETILCGKKGLFKIHKNVDEGRWSGADGWLVGAQRIFDSRAAQDVLVATYGESPLPILHLLPPAHTTTHTHTHTHPHFDFSLPLTCEARSPSVQFQCSPLPTLMPWAAGGGSCRCFNRRFERVLCGS